MEEITNKSGQGLGVAALVTSIITFVLAVIPCIGLIAIIPGVVAIILASVGLSQTARNNAPRGLMIAALIIAIVASMISISQIFVAGKFAQKADKWPNEIQNIFEDVQDNVIRDLEDANVNIKIESNGDKVEINTSSDKKEQEELLEDLEGEKSTEKNDTSGIKK